MNHPRWSDLPYLQEDPRHAVALKTATRDQLETGVRFRSKAGARLVESVARESSDLSIEEVVAFLSHIPGAVRARPFGRCGDRSGTSVSRSPTRVSCAASLD
jgi:hypothetical protein